MKYMTLGGFQNHPMMRWTLTLTLVLLFAFWITSFGMYFSKMDFNPDSVVSYYNGSEDEYRPARTFGSMLEVSHGHLAIMALVILLLTHLVIFIPARDTTKRVFIFGTFSAALLNESSGWLVRFWSPAFAPLKVISFLMLQVHIALLLASLAWFLWRSSGSGEFSRKPPVRQVAK